MMMMMMMKMVLWLCIWSFLYLSLQTCAPFLTWRWLGIAPRSAVSLATRTRAGCPANRPRPPDAYSRAPPSCQPSCLPTRRWPQRGRGQSRNSSRRPMAALMVGEAGQRTVLAVARGRSFTQALPPLARPLPRERSTCEGWERGVSSNSPTHHPPTLQIPPPPPLHSLLPPCAYNTPCCTPFFFLFCFLIFLEHSHHTALSPHAHRPPLPPILSPPPERQLDVK